MPILPPGPLQVERLPDGRRKLLRPLRYKVDGVEAPIEINDIENFTTDFSSDPIGLLDWSKVDVAGVIHDYLYQNPGTVKGIRTRRHEDEVWRKIARAGDWRCSRFTARLGWAGMRLAGWIFREGPRQKARERTGLGIGAAALLGAVWRICECSRALLSVSGEPSLGAFIEVVVCFSIIVPASIRLIATTWRSSQRRRA